MALNLMCNILNKLFSISETLVIPSRIITVECTIMYYTIIIINNNIRINRFYEVLPENRVLCLTNSEKPFLHNSYYNTKT